MDRVKRLSLVRGLALAAVGAAIVGTLEGNRRTGGWENIQAQDIAQGQFAVLANGWRIHYRAVGEGEPLVLLHGFLDSLHSWRLNIDRLALRHRVLAVDMPGFGCSERVCEPVYSLRRLALVLKEFLEQQGVQRASVMGHSLGGALAAQFTYDFPATVDKLILESAAVYIPLPDGRFLTHLPASIPLAAVGLATYGAATLVPQLFHRHREQESVRLRAEGLRVRGTAQALVAMLQSPRESDLPGALSQLTQPTLIIWGARDPIVPLRHARRMRRELPNSRLAILSTAGHLPHEEFPDQVNELIVNFLSHGIESVNG